MDGRGRYLDNIFIERLWRSVKAAGPRQYEDIYAPGQGAIKDYRDGHELHIGLATYFDYYNHERLHQSLDYRTPTAGPRRYDIYHKKG
jgi:putative transposase